MEVIVNEDQLSLAIGKRGQNVRLATKLVGWNIDIRSEEEIKREVAEQMGALIASGGAVPLSAIEGVTAQQTEALAEHNINDIDTLAATNVDDLVEILDVSLDEAESILAAAQAVTAARDASAQVETEGEQVEQHAVSAEEDPNAPAEGVEPNEDMTAAGYDEAVKTGQPYSAEPEILAEYSADPVALTEIDQMTEGELMLQEPQRDLRPDTITPAPDVMSEGAAVIQDEEAREEGELPVEEEALFSPEGDFASEASAPEVQVSSAPAPEYSDAATVESANNEKQSDASENNAAK
jgi:N utilization substance protein A